MDFALGPAPLDSRRRLWEGLLPGAGGGMLWNGDSGTDRRPSCCEPSSAKLVIRSSRSRPIIICSTCQRHQCNMSRQLLDVRQLDVL